MGESNQIPGSLEHNSPSYMSTSQKMSQTKEFSHYFSKEQLNMWMSNNNNDNNNNSNNNNDTNNNGFFILMTWVENHNI